MDSRLRALEPSDLNPNHGAQGSDKASGLRVGVQRPTALVIKICVGVRKRILAWACADRLDGLAAVAILTCADVLAGFTKMADKFAACSYYQLLSSLSQILSVAMTQRILQGTVGCTFSSNSAVYQDSMGTTKISLLDARQHSGGLEVTKGNLPQW